VPEELVYQMTSVIFGNLETLVAAHAAAKGIKLDAASPISPIPLHPGAERFYKEKGIL
jgi:TRAP-type uncharacterized transport system substrate-binding protein